MVILSPTDICSRYSVTVRCILHMIDDVWTEMAQDYYMYYLFLR